MKTKIKILITAFLLASCTDAQIEKRRGLGDEFKIEMINCDGTTGKTWISTGKVHSEQNSDGYYFKDKKSGKLIEVTGRLVITKL